MELASAGAPDTSEEAPGTADAAVVSALSAVDSRLAAGNAAASADAAAPRSVGSADSALATPLGTASKPAICGCGRQTVSAAACYAPCRGERLQVVQSSDWERCQRKGGRALVSGRRSARVLATPLGTTSRPATCDAATAALQSALCMRGCLRLCLWWCMWLGWTCVRSPRWGPLAHPRPAAHSTLEGQARAQGVMHAAWTRALVKPCGGAPLRPRARQRTPPPTRRR